MMNTPLITATKALIALLFLAILAGQIWAVPTIASGLARTAPEFSDLQTPGIVLVDALLLCGQVVLACVWRLLTLVAGDGVFDPRAFRWVDVIIGAVVSAGAIIVVGMWLIAAAQAGSPFLALVGAVAIVTITGLALVVAVMRGLLRQATVLRQEMAGVV